MKKPLFIFLLFVFSVLFSSCRKSAEITKTMNLADSLMLSHPDSSYILMKSIDPDHLFGKSQRAKYALIYTESEYKNYITLENDSLINIAVDYYSENGSENEYARSMMYRGAVLYDMMDYNGAIEAYKKAEDILINSDEYMLMGLVNTRLGELYQHLYYPEDNIIDYYKKAVSNYLKIDDYEGVNSSYCSIGFQYIFLPDKDSVLHYLNESINISKEHNNEAILIRDYYLLTSFYNKNKEYRSTVNTGKQIMKNRNVSSISGIILNMSVALAKMGQIDSARYYYSLVGKDSPTTLFEYLPLYKIEECAGNYNKALNYFVRSTEISDSILNVRKKQNVIEIDKRFDNNRLKTEIQTLQFKKKISVLTIILSISISISIIILSIVIIRRKQRVIRENSISLEQLMEDSIRYKKEIEEYHNQNNSKAPSKTLLDRQMKTFDSLIELSYRYENFDQAFFKKFKTIMNNISKDSDVLKEMEEIVNIKYNNILVFLKEKHPFLKSDDLYLIALICLGFSPISISLFLSYSSTSSLYVRKSRLAERMGLKCSLSLYISDIKKALCNDDDVIQ